MSRKKLRNAKNIIDRLKRQRSVKTYQHLARDLEISSSTLGSWLHRGYVSYESLAATGAIVDYNITFRGKRYVPDLSLKYVRERQRISSAQRIEELERENEQLQGFIRGLEDIIKDAKKK